MGGYDVLTDDEREHTDYLIENMMWEAGMIGYEAAKGKYLNGIRDAVAEYILRQRHVTLV